MLHGLSVHQKLSDTFQTSAVSSKRVAQNAFKTGAISKPQLQSARSALVSADEAKHSVVARVTSWADADVDDDDSFSFRGDAANVFTQVEDNQNEPATKRDGPIGLTANAPVFVPTPAPVRDSPFVNGYTGFNEPSAGFNGVEGSCIPTIGQQLDYMLASNFMGQGLQGGQF